MPNQHKEPGPGVFWTWPRKHSELPAGVPRNAPGLMLVLGVDGTSAGLTVKAWRNTAGDWPQQEVLFTRRWAHPCMTYDEALLTAYRGLAELLRERAVGE